MRNLDVNEIQKGNLKQAEFVCDIYNDNIQALHGKQITVQEWNEILSIDDLDEQNFLIYKDKIPVAWLRINGLLNKDMAWLSMLTVSNNMHRKGVGSYAVRFAEKFVREKGFAQIGIHTTDDNIPAQDLYQKCGYAITEYGDCTTGDGAARKGYTFKKVLSTEISYKQLYKCDLSDNMLDYFNRYQDVKKYYAKQGSFLEVQDCDFIESWDKDKKHSIIYEDLCEVLEYGGTIYGAFDNDKLIGFSCFDGRFIGNESQYLQLIYLHVSCEYRNRRIGRTLFSMCADSARKQEAKKLYISANSSYSTQQFYRSMGCVQATENIVHLCDADPYDIQMEYDL
ncbi:MAG: GNAT family N-acetyltransferase [Clostridia bacterium]